MKVDLHSGEHYFQFFSMLIMLNSSLKVENMIPKWGGGNIFFKCQIKYIDQLLFLIRYILTQCLVGLQRQQFFQLSVKNSNMITKSSDFRRDISAQSATQRRTLLGRVVQQKLLPKVCTRVVSHQVPFRREDGAWTEVAGVEAANPRSGRKRGHRPASQWAGGYHRRTELGQSYPTWLQFISRQLS